jgi:hypothetical protein
MLWNLLGSALFLDGVRRPSARTWLAYGVVQAAAIWTNLTGGFTVAAHGLVYLAVVIHGRVARRSGRPALPGAASRWPWIGFLVAGGLGVALYAALVPEMMHELGKQAGIASVNVKVREWTNPLWTVKEAMRQAGIGPFALAGLAAGALLALAGFVSIVRRDWVAAAIMIVPAPVALGLLLLLEFHIWPRYFFPLFGFLLVFVVRGIEVAAAALAGRAGPRLAMAAVVLLAIGSVFTLRADWRLPKQDYEGARDFVEAERRPGEPVITAGLAGIAYQWHYAKERQDWIAVDDLAALDRAAADAPRAWFVYSFPTVLATSHPELYERVQSRFELVREFPGTVGDGTVFVTRSR